MPRAQQSLRKARRVPPLEFHPLFITPAFAQASGASGFGSSDMLIQFAPFIVIFAIMLRFTRIVDTTLT